MTSLNHYHYFMSKILFSFVLLAWFVPAKADEGVYTRVVQFNKTELPKTVTLKVSIIANTVPLAYRRDDTTTTTTATTTTGHHDNDELFSQ